MARLDGFEPPTHGLEVRSSIHLSYRRLICKYTTCLNYGQGNLGQKFLNEVSRDGYEFRQNSEDENPLALTAPRI